MQKILSALLTLLLTTPLISSAQSPSLQSLFTNIPIFIDKVLIPFLYGMAFLVFTYNAIRYFVIEGSNEKGREKAKDLAIYSIAAFVFITIFLGIVNMFTQSTGLDKQTQPCTDFEKEFGGCPTTP